MSWVRSIRLPLLALAGIPSLLLGLLLVGDGVGPSVG
jgi:hypothetical protein